MIESFGDYHRLFWNCQTFAECFLQLICEDSASFNAFTTAEASNLVVPHVASVLFLPIFVSPARCINGVFYVMSLMILGSLCLCCRYSVVYNPSD